MEFESYGQEQKLQEKPRKPKKNKALTAIGVILALLGGGSCLFYAYIISHSLGVLWGIILVIIMMEQVSSAKAKYPSRGLFIGIMALIGSIAVIVLMFFSHSAWWLVALLLVAALSDEFV